MREIKNALIEKTYLGYEDHGIMTAYIYLDYGDAGHQAFGGYGMGGEFGMKFIKEVLKIASVQSWEELVGKYVKADKEHVKIHRLGNIIKDEWFDPKEII